ncbi:MAG TPA: hypothetical protein VMU67_08025 [Steroidobacteraceae bacterium]|nr:hypothetical protein [Steroidobacteraceae bacterium]
MNETHALEGSRPGAHLRATPRVFLRLLLSAAACLSLALIALQLSGVLPASELPLGLERVAQGGYVVRARSDRALPPGLHAGERVDYRDMTRADRAALVASGNIPPGTPITLAVVRAGRIVRIPIAASGLLQGQLERYFYEIDGLLSMSFLFVLALLTLWRGRDAAAWGLFAFSLGVLVSNALTSIPAAPPANVWMEEVGQSIQILTALPGLYVMAEALAQSGLSPRARRGSRLVMVVLALALFGESTVGRMGPTYRGVVSPYWVYVSARPVLIAMTAMPVLILLAGYRRAAHESRLRIRWVLWSTALLLATIVAFTAVTADREPYLFQVVSVLQGLSLLGYVYAVLRSRLVDVSFVLDRALVFALITGLLFGVFSLLEQALHHFAVGERLSWAVQAVVALAMAMGLSPLHHRLERWIERIFFHHQILAVAALRRFATECAFVEREERLVELAIERLLTHCAAAAVYERTSAGYRLRAARGFAWPRLIDADDQVFVSLRAHQQEVDLEEVANAIAAEGYAFPMSVAETLSGAVVCRPRDGEQFAPDVRAALEEVARNLGMSLYILRNREQAQLVADIAADRIDESAARRRAAALVQGPADAAPLVTGVPSGS